MIGSGFGGPYRNYMFHGFAPKTLGTGATAVVLACIVGFATLRSPMPDREAARESLDMLKAATAAGASGQGHVGSCLSAIADAIRVEGRSGVAEGAVRRSWHDAAGRCTVLLHALCDGSTPPGTLEGCRERRDGP